MKAETLHDLCLHGLPFWCSLTPDFGLRGQRKQCVTIYVAQSEKYDVAHLPHTGQQWLQRARAA